MLHSSNTLWGQSTPHELSSVLGMLQISLTLQQETGQSICYISCFCMLYDFSVFHASELLLILSSCHYSEHRQHWEGTWCTLMTHQAQWSRGAGFCSWQLEVGWHHVELLLIYHLKKLIVASPYGTGIVLSQISGPVAKVWVTTPAGPAMGVESSQIAWIFKIANFFKLSFFFHFLLVFQGNVLLGLTF